MFKHLYLVQVAHSNEDGNGMYYKVLVAKNKKKAVEKALRDEILVNHTCIIVSVKRFSKKISNIMTEHNNNISKETK